MITPGHEGERAALPHEHASRAADWGVMSTPPSEVAGALPPPSGPPLPADLTPPPPPPAANGAYPNGTYPAEATAADALLAEAAGTEAAAEEPVAPRRRINPDVVVPVGAWPEGTWDPVPEPDPVDPTLLVPAEEVRAAASVPRPETVAEADEPSLFATGERVPGDPRPEPAPATAPVAAATGAGAAGTLPPSTRDRADAASRPPRAGGRHRWAKVGGGAAVLFAAAAGIAVAVNGGGGSGDTGAAPTAAAVTNAPATTAAPTTAAPTTAAATTTPAPATTAPATTTTPATTVAPTTSPATTAAAPTTVPGTPAADVLAAVPVAAERTGGFAVTQYPTAPFADGCDLTTQLLRRDSRVPVQTAPDAPCTVVAGRWVSPYDGAEAEDPAALALDRPVTMREAWESGASTWTPAQRAAFVADVADPRTARLATAAVVRAKGDRDPSAWLPEGPARCTYLADYLSVKARWGLSMDRAEADRVRTLLQGECAGLTVAPWAAPPAPPELPTSTTVPYYLDCNDAAARGVTSIPRGAPGYRDALDGNGNGIACE